MQTRSDRNIKRKSSFHLDNYQKVERVYELISINNVPKIPSSDEGSRNIDREQFDSIMKAAHSNNCIEIYKKRQIRSGIPNIYRPYVWLLAVGIPMEDSIDTIIDHYISRYNASLRSIFGTCNFDEITIPDDNVPSFVSNNTNRNSSLSYLNFHCLSKNGIKAAKRLMCVISQMYPVNNCAMLPNIICMLLSSLPEVLIPPAMGEMMKRSDFYFFIGNKERQQVVTNTYVELMEKKISSKTNIHKNLNMYSSSSSTDLGDNTRLELKPEAFILFDIMTKYFFLNIISYEHVLQIFDVYMFEGRKILFRFTLSLMHEFYLNRTLCDSNNVSVGDAKHSNGSNDSNLFASGILSNFKLLRDVGNRFDSNTMKQIFKRAFNYRLRRQDINAKMKINSNKTDIKIDMELLNEVEEAIANLQNNNYNVSAMAKNVASNGDCTNETEIRNASFFRPRIVFKDETITKNSNYTDSYLLKNETNVLMKLYKYVPKVLHQKDLKLLYHAATEGYSLKNLIIAYRAFKGSTILCIEPLPGKQKSTGDNANGAGKEIIGIFTPTSWFPDDLIFPTLGSCPADTFVFSLKPKLIINRINKNNIDDLVNCTIINASSRKKTVNDEYLIFGIDTKESLKMALRIDGDLKYGQSTANNIFKNMSDSLSYMHGEKEFLMKNIELYGFVER
jgi:hypothetical protein